MTDLRDARSHIQRRFLWWTITLGTILDLFSVVTGIAALILAFESRAQLEGTLPGCVASRRDSAPQIEASPMAGLLSLPRRIGANRSRRRWTNTQRAYLRRSLVL